MLPGPGDILTGLLTSGCPAGPPARQGQRFPGMRQRGMLDSMWPRSTIRCLELAGRHPIADKHHLHLLCRLRERLSITVSEVFATVSVGGPGGVGRGCSL